MKVPNRPLIHDSWYVKTVNYVHTYVFLNFVSSSVSPVNICCVNRKNAVFLEYNANILKKIALLVNANKQKNAFILVWY